MVAWVNGHFFISQLINSVLFLATSFIHWGIFPLYNKIFSNKINILFKLIKYHKIRLCHIKYNINNIYHISYHFFTVFQKYTVNKISGIRGISKILSNNSFVMLNDVFFCNFAVFSVM